MEFIMDMVHHNPGEPPFETSFLNPEKLAAYGYNAQVFKHINTAVTFSATDPSLFDDAPDALAWINHLRKSIMEEIIAAKHCGLKVFYHIDLFVLPRVVVDRYHDEICDENGRISLERTKTQELHRAMLDEIFSGFPIDGLIIRVGETYLFDTPYHVGNGAIRYGEIADEQDAMVALISFLREEVCVKHGKHLFFRTWDTYNDRFHANPDYYLAVTNRIETHQKLLFSIKHTALDFWRRVKFNECLTLGNHQQIIEVQCQREYEGKGAYPMYVMNGVINAFCENVVAKGLKDIADHPLIAGVYTWSRGGGWYGPYPQNEFWCDLNAYVIARYAADPNRTELEIFNEHALKVMGLAQQDLPAWRQLCLVASDALLHGRYIAAYDHHTAQRIMPSANWMRDDMLGGLEQLRAVFDYLWAHGFLEAALIEKKTSCLLWQETARLWQQINVPDRELSAFITASIEYALRLFTVVYCGWEVMSIGYHAERTGRCDTEAMTAAIRSYDAAWLYYQEMAKDPYASTLYRDFYHGNPGLGATVQAYRERWNK